MVLRIMAAFLATLCFALLFNCPKKEIVLSGLTGAFGWLVFEFASLYISSDTILIYLASVSITALSRVLAFKRKNPITLYLVAGVIPLVPGAGIYYTAYNLLIGESATAFQYGMGTLSAAGVISFGIMCVFSLPYKLFSRLAGIK